MPSKCSFQIRRDALKMFVTRCYVTQVCYQAGKIHSEMYVPVPK